MVHADVEVLEQLSAELTARGFETSLITPEGRLPWLNVRNPRAPMLAETVMAQDGWFWWPWADRIASTDDVDGAAGRVASVLRVSGSRWVAEGAPVPGAAPGA